MCCMALMYKNAPNVKGSDALPLSPPAHDVYKIAVLRDIAAEGRHGAIAKEVLASGDSSRSAVADPTAYTANGSAQR